MKEYVRQVNQVIRNKHTSTNHSNKFTNYKNDLDKAKLHLTKKDTVLAGIIEKIGTCRLKPHKKYFENLVDGIISQQLSLKAAESILNRFKKLFDKRDGFPSPEEIVKTGDERLRSCGLSNAKVKYVKDLSSKVIDGTIKIHILDKLSDEEIIEELIQVKGIGEWTAHMFLIFCLGRINILPIGDLGFRKAIMLNYKLRKIPDDKKINYISNKYNWKPYQSVATWYLWQSLSLINRNKK